MLKNYLKTALRNFQKNKALSIINLGGLSIGIAAVLLIGMYIYTETGYDSFHRNKSSLYRIGFSFWQNGKLMGTGAQFTPPFGPDAMNEIPGIESFVRISSDRVAYISYRDKTLKVGNIHHADSNFFSVFSYRLSEGNASSVLKEPYSIVLTEETAANLFGQENPLGKVVRLDNQTDYMVTGIAQTPPQNSHLVYKALLSFSTLYKEPGNFMDWNGGEQYMTYIQLKEGVNPASLEKKFPAFMWKHINEEYAKVGFKIDASLQPIRKVHLYYSDNSAALRTNIYVFSIVALLILIISCVNYVNLTTAQATTRFKEVGVRKVLGAARSQLVRQFLLESIVVTVISFIIACALVMLAKPAYQQTLGKNLPSFNAGVASALLLLFIIITTAGAIAGSYIALYVSSFNVTRIFKALLPRSGQTIFKKALIVTQYVISAGLLSCTLLVALQLRYMKNTNPGYDREGILVLPLVGEKTKQSYTTLVQQLVQLPEVKQTSAVSEIPYDGITSNGFIPEGTTKAMVIHQLDADENFPATFNIKLVAGNYFSKDYPTTKDAYIINETLAKTLQWENPVGKVINRNGAHKVLGVIKDFHFASLHYKIEPLIITNGPAKDQFAWLAVKYRAANTSVFLDHIKQAWKNTVSDAPFDYWFLDDAVNTIYKSEEQFQRMFLYFSALSVLLTLAGVIGLAALTIKQRTKEFGIRRVLGARITDIIKVSIKDFVWLIGIAIVIAAPLAWYYMNGWLQNFAYRIAVSWWMFAVCGLTVFLITISIISFQALKATLVNPVKSLRTE